MIKNNCKNNILSIETTSNICGVSIVSDNKVLYENNQDNGLNHSITLFNNINEALKKSKLDMKDISIIKVSNGPGSFTGIRIGIATAIGLSKPYNTLIEYVDTLDTLATNVYRFIYKETNNNEKDTNKNNHYMLSMIDARVDRVYISLYNGYTKEKISKDSIITINELCDKLNSYFIDKSFMFLLVGSGAVNYKSYFKSKLKINYKIIYKFSDLSSSSLAYTKGIISKVPFTNYMMASKAERDRIANL